MLPDTPASEHAMRSRPEDLQVGRDHYFEDDYLTPERLASYRCQIALAHAARPASAIEVGPGPGTVTRELRKRHVRVTTVDIDPALEPGVCASVTDLPSTLEPADVVLCCQVLEHLPYSTLEALAVRLYALARKRLILSLPDAGPYLRVSLHTSRRRLGVGDRICSLPLWASARRSIVCPQHCWEIGVGGLTARAVRQALALALNGRVQSSRLLSNPYHHFFLVDRPRS